MALLMCWTIAAMLFGAEEPGAPQVASWAELLRRVESDPTLESARMKLIEEARERAELPIIRRAKKLEDVGKHRTWLDGRSNALEDEIRETFALAMSDFAACRVLSDELPLLAAAYRLTGAAKFRDRILAQFEEMVWWSPLRAIAGPLTTRSSSTFRRGLSIISNPAT